MHVEYQVRLPDHDWVVAERHKLIPSLYAAIKIEPNQFGQRTSVGYSGPTYIAIRSGKHDSSTAESHALDLDTVFGLDEFREFVKTPAGDIKPVVIVTVDGGPDENARYAKVIDFAIKHFKKYDLDGLFVSANARGRSAYNRVERRMAPLSRELSGVILPHDHFGSHLDSSGKTVDEELEIKNFEEAGKVLASIWNGVQIDNYPAVAGYISPPAPNTDNVSVPAAVSQKWRAAHVRESQYCLQVVRCNDVDCCSPWRSSLRHLLPGRFLPNPVPVKHSGQAIVTSNADVPIFLPLFVNVQLNNVIQQEKIGNFVVPPYMICTVRPSSLILVNVAVQCVDYTMHQ